METTTDTRPKYRRLLDGSVFMSDIRDALMDKGLPWNEEVRQYVKQKASMPELGTEQKPRRGLTMRILGGEAPTARNYRTVLDDLPPADPAEDTPDHPWRRLYALKTEGLGLQTPALDRFVNRAAEGMTLGLVGPTEANPIPVEEDPIAGRVGNLAEQAGGLVGMFAGAAPIHKGLAKLAVKAGIPALAAGQATAAPAFGLYGAASTHGQGLRGRIEAALRDAGTVMALQGLPAGYGMLGRAAGGARGAERVADALTTPLGRRLNEAVIGGGMAAMEGAPAEQVLTSALAMPLGAAAAGGAPGPRPRRPVERPGEAPPRTEAPPATILGRLRQAMEALETAGRGAKEPTEEPKIPLEGREKDLLTTQEAAALPKAELARRGLRKQDIKEPAPEDQIYESMVAELRETNPELLPPEARTSPEPARRPSEAPGSTTAPKKVSGGLVPVSGSENRFYDPATGKTMMKTSEGQMVPAPVRFRPGGGGGGTMAVKPSNEVRLGAAGAASKQEVLQAAETALRVWDVPVKIADAAIRRPVKAAARAIGRRLGNTKAGEKVLEAQRKIQQLTPADYLQPEARKPYRRLVGANKAAEHQAAQDILDPFKKLQQQAHKQYRKTGGGLNRERFEMVAGVVKQYSGPGGLDTARRYAKDVPKKWKWLADEAVRVLENPERYPLLMGYVGQLNDLYNRMWDAKNPGEPVPEFEKGVTYLPEHTLVPTEKGKRATTVWLRPQSSGKFDRRHPSDKAKAVRGGVLQRLAVGGKIPADMNPATVAAREYADVMGVLNARKMYNELRGATIEDSRSGERVPVLLWGNSKEFKQGVDQGAYAEFQARGFQPARFPVDVEGAMKLLATGPKLYVHRDVIPTLKSYVEPGYDGFVGGAVRLTARLKMAKLALSPFHYWALWMNTAGLGGNPVSSRKILDDPLVRDALKSTEFTLQGPDVKRDFLSYDRAIKANPTRSWANPVKWLFKVQRWNERHLWENTYRVTKATALKAVYHQGRRMGMPHQEALSAAAVTTNKLHGGIDWAWHGIGRKQREFLSFIALAPDWQISNWQFFLQGATDTSKKGSLARMGMARIMGGTFLFGNVMNMMTTGKPMWENEEGKRHMVAFDLGGKRFYFDPWRHFGEQITVVLGIWNQLAPEKSEIPEGRDPYLYMTGKLSAVAKLAIDVASGRDFFSGRALPSAGDLKEGNWHGQWGKSNRGLAPWTVAALRAMMPISMESIVQSVFEGENPLENSRVLSGATGWHISEDYKKNKVPQAVYAPADNTSSRRSTTRRGATGRSTTRRRTQ